MECGDDQGNWEKLLQSALQIFNKSLKEQINILQEAVCNKEDPGSINWLSIERSAHRIKGSAGCFGYEEICNLASRIESNARETRSRATHSHLIQALKEQATEIEKRTQ